jgi:hypothetical protein
MTDYEDLSDQTIKALRDKIDEQQQYIWLLEIRLGLRSGKNDTE